MPCECGEYPSANGVVFPAPMKIFKFCLHHHIPKETRRAYLEAYRAACPDGSQSFLGSKDDGLKSIKSKRDFRPVLQYSVTLHRHLEETVSEMTDTTEEKEIQAFMMSYVATLFNNTSSLTLEQKSAFGKCVRTEIGQTWFAKAVNSQRSRWKRVSDTTFFGLVQHFAIVLFECCNSDHFFPAKTLMNMCFTFYHEVQVPGCEPFREYLSVYLRNQKIWRNPRFWNAAFFDALQCARSQKPVLTQKELLENDVEALMDEKQYQENIAFGHLGTFMCNMHAFGLDKDFCQEFLQKQYTIASLPHSQEKILQEHMNRLYEQTEFQ